MGCVGGGVSLYSQAEFGPYSMIFHFSPVCLTAMLTGLYAARWLSLSGSKYPTRRPLILLHSTPTPHTQPTIFDKIAQKQIPTKFIYEDDQCVAFHDLGPQGPVHFLVIPKEKQGLTRLSKATEGNKALLGHLLYVAQHVAKEQVCLSVYVCFIGVYHSNDQKLAIKRRVRTY